MKAMKILSDITLSFRLSKKSLKKVGIIIASKGYVRHTQIEYINKYNLYLYKNGFINLKVPITIY